MEQRDLGHSGLRVPVVGMGTWRTFDVTGAAREANARAIVDAALETDANFFDSSPMYGQAERVLGLALEGRRDQALVASKVWTPSAAEGEAQARRALGYFGGRIDLYQIHNLVAWREHLTMLERLRDAGTGRRHRRDALQPLRLRRAGEWSCARGASRAIQIPYNPLERAVERVILPLAADLGLGVVVMRPFGEGALLRRTPITSGPRAVAPLRRDDLAAGAAEVGSERSALLAWRFPRPRGQSAWPRTPPLARHPGSVLTSARW